MFYKLYIILFLAVLIIFFSGCTSEFELKGLDVSPQQYIVNGILYQDSLAKIYVGQSYVYDQNGRSGFIEDAEVFLSWDREGTSGEEPYREQLVFLDSFYVSSSIMETNTDYHLEVILPDGVRLFSTTNIPDPVSIQSTRLLFPAGYMDEDNSSGPFARYFMDFGSRAGTEQYHEVYIYRYNPHTTDQEGPYSLLKTYNNDELILAEGLPSNSSYTFLFSTGQEVENEITLAFDSTGTLLIFDVSYYIVLQTVSREYYLYKKSLYAHLDALQLQDNFSTNDFYIPGIFKQVVPVYSNIDGGKGIFAGISRDEKQTNCNLVGNVCE